MSPGLVSINFAREAWYSESKKELVGVSINMTETNREWKLPKNVRQIMDGGGDRKIYIEDYVMTYLEGIAKKGEQKKAILFGEVREQELYPYIFVNGAMEVENFSPDNSAREELQAQMGKYFSGKRVVGWFLSAKDTPFLVTPEITEIFQREFSGENQLLLVTDPEEKETSVYMMEGEHPLQQPGYYIYYEKNPAMQEYMIAQNGGKSVEKEEPVKDDAIRRFRKIIGEKKKLPQLPSPGRLVYLAGGFLVVTVLALGVTMVYNYDRMKEVERSLARLTNNVDSQSQYLEGDADTAQVMLHIDESLNLQEQAEAETTSGTEAVETLDPSGTQNADTESPDTGAAQTMQSIPQTENSTESQKDVPASAVARASYTVKMGDTLAGISEMYYGDIGRVTEICALNGIDDENTILPGQKILLP